MRKIKFKSKEEKRIEGLEDENVSLKMALIELDVEKQTEIDLLKLALIEQDIEIQTLKGVS